MSKDGKENSSFQMHSQALSCFDGLSVRQPAGAIMITGFFCLAVHKETM